MADYGDMLGRKEMSFKGTDGSDMPVVFDRGGAYRFSDIPAAPQKEKPPAAPPKEKRSYKAVFGKPYIASPSEVDKLHDK
ncbi:MAG: hypothetical protein LBP62_02215 [Clostridiales bacterium]|jgi:hypothetical protein|nr:hypothetical protein [Clostridiales bacterium]